MPVTGLGYYSEEQIADIVNDAADSGAAVSSFNTRTGAVTLSSGDVTTALTFTPVTNARTISTTAPLTGGGDLSANRTFAITSSALSKVDDTNVTLTLGGTPGSALLAATSITVGWTGSLSVARGGTGDTGTAWSQTTPTPTSGTGTFTSVAAQVRVKTLGKSVEFSVCVTITTNGTAGQLVSVGMPFTSVTGKPQAWGGKETAVGGLGLTATIASASSALLIQNYDATYPGGDGRVLVINGVCETA